MTGSELLKNKGCVTTCLTDDCNRCTGSYVNLLIQHRIICNCKCHQIERAINKDKRREEQGTTAQATKESRGLIRQSD